MDIRIITYLIVILGGFVYKQVGARREALNARKQYIIFICIILAAVSGLRGLNVGPDTQTYFNWFEYTKSTSWNEVFNNFFLTYIDGTERDPGYTLFVKSFQTLFNNWQFFLITISAFYYFALGKFLYRNTRTITDVVFALVLYVSLFQIIALSGIRQQIAVGFAFFALDYMISKQFIKFLIIVIIASQFHISALVLIPFGLSIYLPRKTTIFLYYIAIGLIPVVVIYGRSIVAFLADLLVNDYYAAYATSDNRSGAFTYLLFSISVSIAGLFTIRKNLFGKNSKIYYSAIAFMTFFVPLILIDGSLIRLGQYFSLYLMIFIPLLINSYKIEYDQKLVIFYILIFTLIYLSLIKTFEYDFFWQQV